MRSIERCLELHRRRPAWFLKDPAGMVIAGFSWTIMVVSIFSIWISISFWVGIFSLVGFLESIALTTSMAMCMWSHYMVMTTDPGVVPKKRKDSGIKPFGSICGDGKANNEEESDESDVDEEEVDMPLEEFEDREDDGSLLVFCDDCNIYRPTRAMHCETCEQCVILMDHHCPWVNNCVGIGNQKYFLLFLFYVTVTSAHVLGLVVLQRWSCSNGLAFCGFDAGKFPGRLGVWLVAGSCVFGLFCIIMLTMEIYSIDEDPIYSTIAKRLHVRTGCKSKSRVERHLSVIFGTNGFERMWLLPLPRHRSRQEWQIIGGFLSNSAEDGQVC